MKIRKETLQDIHPYEILKIEFIPETEEDYSLLKNKKLLEENLIQMQVLQIISDESPLYVVKAFKDNVGIGN